MTLDEEIKHCEEVAEEQAMKAGFETDNQTYIMSEMERERCRECAEEHRQLAKWLNELKAYREILANADKIIKSEYGCVILEGYADVVDRMIEVFMEVNADDNN